MPHSRLLAHQIDLLEAQESKARFRGPYSHIVAAGSLVGQFLAVWPSCSQLPHFWGARFLFSEEPPINSSSSASTRSFVSIRSFMRIKRSSNSITSLQAL
jgi:hypothetical protein